MGLSLTINGAARELDQLNASATLAQVITELGLKSDRIAVEHNGEIAARDTWGTTQVESGDRLEIVHFVGGGTDPGSSIAGLDLYCT